jgi:hypothetical protein
MRNMFSEMLTLMFIFLKLTAVINWSWWLVLAPFYIPILMSSIIVGIRSWKGEK